MIIAISAFTTVRSRGVGAAFVAAVVLMSAWSGQSASAAENPSGLTVNVSDGAAETSPGDDRTFEATLTNTGPDAVDAVMVLTPPSYATITDSDDAIVAAPDLTWPVSVEPGQSRTVSATINIGDIPDSEYQVTTLASVYLGELTGAPLIRAADVNSIPGVSNPATPPSASSASQESAPIDGPLLVGLLVAVPIVIAGAAVGGVLVQRRRRAMRSS